VFFAPWRRGQGLSETAGPYIMNDINAAWEKDGISAAAAVLVRRHETDQVDDQLAGLAWLRTATFVAPGRIATPGRHGPRSPQHACADLLFPGRERL
jgi:hypothetical protein